MRKMSVAAIAAAVLLLAATASADSVQLVVSPSSVLWRVGGDTVFLVGDGFDIEAGMRSWEIPAVTAGGCLGTDITGSGTACRAGDIIDLSAHTPGEVSFGLGQAALDGQNLTDFVLFGSLNFTATPALFPDTTSPQVFLTEPFIFTGVIRGFQDGRNVFNLGLTGTGTTSRLFRLTDDGVHYGIDPYSDALYRFGAEPVSATPEPASLLLLGTGLFGLGAARRRRQVSRPR